MKILQAHKFFYLNGGADRVFFDTSALLEKNGHKVLYFSMKHPDNFACPFDRYFVSQSAYENNTLKNRISNAVNIIYSPEARRKMDILLSEHKPDIAHLHNIYHQLSPSILHSLTRRKVPVVMTLHDYKMVCPSYSMLNKGKPCEACKGGAYQHCFLNACVKNSRNRSFLLTAEMFLHHKIMRIYNLVDIFISPSLFLKNKLEEMGFKGKIVHLPNFVETGKANPVYGGDGKTIVYLGRLSPEKGLLTLLDAVKGLPGISLNMLGGGPMKPLLEEKIKKENIANAFLLGYKSGAELQAEVEKAMFVVLPSECYENNPRCILEAFAQGKPVIGSNIGGIPELIKENVTGMTFKPADTEELRAKIWLLSRNPGKIVEMGKECLRTVEDDFSPRRYYEGLKKIYAKAMHLEAIPEKNPDSSQVPVSPFPASISSLQMQWPFANMSITRRERLNISYFKFLRALFLAICVFLLPISGISAPETAVITISADEKLGELNRNVFGNNFIGYDPRTYEDWPQEYYGYSDFGAGVWDPKWKKPVKETIALAGSAGISIARFPGGCGAHRYNWKSTIGSKRVHFLFGLDEFLKTCKDINAEAVITISYFTGNENDAADLVEYLNAPDDNSNLNGGIDWAKERAQNGHPEPYHVPYFEIGNEVWHGDHREIKSVSPEDYARRYLKYYEKMKKVDPSVQIGAILCLPEWDTAAASIIKDRIDFGIIHMYPSPEVSDEKLAVMDPRDIFKITLAVPELKFERVIRETLALLKKTAGKDVPLAITEYNGGFAQDEPVPYRHCLGTALANAEFLKVLTQPQNRILMANYWQFSNNYWGMVYSKEDFIRHDYRYSLEYVKRPNYFVFELYAQHFGEILIPVTVAGPAFTIKDSEISEPIRKFILKIKNKLLGRMMDERKIPADVSIPYLSANASKNRQGDTVYLMVINKNMEESVTARIDLRGFEPDALVKAWVLTGPRIESTNETDPRTVRVTERESGLTLTFEPRSLTAIEIKSE
ncbi:MAG: glycosyltransferase [Candidatus Omnitrophota bacterium]|jgi:glycosyltransferase involved in cell wall biosynthesis/alpha-L-arabinofuranosidase